MSEILELVASDSHDAISLAEHHQQSSTAVAVTSAENLSDDPTTVPAIQSLSIPVTSSVSLPSGTPLPINLELFDSISVQAQIVLGQVNITFGELTRLREGDLIETDRMVHQPVDVLVNGNVVARGELVAVGDCFGVKLTQVAINGAG